MTGSETVVSDARPPAARARERAPFIPRSALIGMAALAVLAIVMPPGATARLLAGESDPDHIARVRAGVWAFKAFLLFHAAVWGILARARTPVPSPLLPPRSAEPAPRWTTPALVGLLVLAAVIRLVHLDAGLWYDEITTLVEHVRAPVGEIVSRFRTQNLHPLYSLGAHGMIALFGESATTLRLPAAVLGVGSLAALYMLAVRIVPHREALFATALLTVSYHHVWFSQNARGYTGLMLFALTGTALLIDLLRQERWAGWWAYIAYAAVMALGIYTHLTGAFVLITHAVVVGVLFLRRRGPIRPQLPLLAALLLAGTFSLQLYAFVLPQMPETLFFRSSRLATTEWKSPLWLFAETVRGLSEGVPGGWVGLIGGTAVVAAGVMSWYWRSRVVLALMVLPGLLMAAVLLGTNHNLWPRFFFFAAGFGALIAVRGVYAVVSPLGARGRAIASIVLLAGVAANAVLVPRAWLPKQDYRGALAWIEANRQPGDGVATAGMTRIVYDWYLPTAWARVRTLADLEAVEGSHVRTWFVYTMPNHFEATAPEVAARVLTQYREVERFPGTLGDGDIRITVNR